LDRRVASAKRGLLLLAIPTALFSAYLFMEGDMLGLAAVSLTGGVIAAFILYYNTRRVPRRIDEHLISIILHMYVVSQGEVGPDDLVKVIAETEDYGYYSEVFRRIRELAKKFGYGFTKATSHIARTVKPPFRDILIRCTEIFSTTNPKGFLELESSTMMEEYSGYYLRSVEAMRVLSGIFSTFQSVIIFIIMTLSILTVFTSDPNIVYYSYAISIPAILAIFLGFKSVVPKNKLIHMDKDEPPRLYRAFRLTLPLALASAAPAMVVAQMVGYAYGFILMGLALLIPGILAYKFETFVMKVDEHYPALIKCLGENLVSTSSFRAALSYVLYMDLGPLKSLLKRALARVSIGISNEKSMSLLSSEAASYRVYMTNKMFLDSLGYGGNPLEVGKILGNNFVKFLEFRKRRLSVAKNLKAVILILQPMVIALLVITRYLCSFFSESLVSLPFFAFGEIPVPVIETGNLILALLIAVINAQVIREVRGGFYGTSFLYTGILLILSGVSWLVAELLMDVAFTPIARGLGGFI